MQYWKRFLAVLLAVLMMATPLMGAAASLARESEPDSRFRLETTTEIGRASGSRDDAELVVPPPALIPVLAQLQKEQAAHPELAVNFPDEIVREFYAVSRFAGFLNLAQILAHG